MKTKTLLRHLNWVPVVCLLAGICFFSSGCTTILVTQKAKGNSLDRTYAPDSLVSAEKLPNGDLQFTAHGHRGRKDSEGADYTLVVSKADLDAALKDAAREEVAREMFATLRATRTQTRQPDGVALSVETFQQGVDQRKILDALDGGKPVVLAIIMPEKMKNKNGAINKNGMLNKGGILNNVDAENKDETKDKEGDRAESENKSPGRDSIVIYYSEPLPGGKQRLVASVEALKKPAPAFYALTPLSAAVDLATSPLQVAFLIVVAIVAP